MTTIRLRLRLCINILLRSALLLLVASAFGQQPSPANQQHNPPAAVVLGKQTLYTVHAGFGLFSPAERARATNRRLERLVKDVLVAPQAITTDEHEDNTDIIAGDLILATVIDADALAAGSQRSSLAAEYARRMRAGLLTARDEHTYKRRVLGALYAALATLVLLAFLLALRVLSPLVYAAIERWRDSRLPAIRIQSLELVSAARLTALLIQAAKLVRIAITLLLLYFYIPLLFSFFPLTQSFGDTLLDYVLAPIRAGAAALLSYLPNLIIVLLVLCFSYFVIRIARFVFREIERGTVGWPGFYPEWAMPTCRLIEILILAFSLVVMFPYLPGSDSPAFRGVSIFLGVLFSLGSSSAVANIVSGVILTYTRAFRVGDYVQIADTVGTITAKTLLATHVQTIKNAHITIPNSLVLGSHIINFSASAEQQKLILNTSVTIGYDAPWRQVHALLISAAARTAGVVPEPQPFVLQTDLNDFYVCYEINAFTDRPHDMPVIYSDLRQNIQDAFNDAGVEIMSPHYTAVRDGNATAIPDQYLPSGYTPPFFRFWHARNGGDTIRRGNAG